MNCKHLSFAILGLILSNFAYSASIYKCTRADKSIIFTNGICPANTQATVVHQETAQDIERGILADKTLNIKRLIAANQAEAAKEYALKNNLSEVYQEQLGLFLNQKAEEEKQTAERDKQRQLEIQQQALAVQQQQLELQRQQIALEKKQQEQQQVRNNQAYYPYYYGYSSPYITRPITNRCQPPYCSSSSSFGQTHSHSSSAGVNSSQPFQSQINPIPGFSLQLNTPPFVPFSQPLLSIQLNHRHK